MRRWFASLPIHRKLVALALLVSSAALLTAFVGLLAYDIARFRTTAEDDARALAQVLAENTAAALVFDDADAARETVGSVRVRPTVRVACVYRDDGSLLASFERDADVSCPATPLARRTWRSVESRVEVHQNDHTVGAVYVERELSDLGARIVATAAAGVLMLMISGAIALGLARALQRVVSRPIVQLAEAAALVGRGQQYTLPSIDAPPDETGELVKAFEDMVRRVGEANAALVASNDALRDEVEQRRHMQAEREALLSREREASRLKDEFLAAVSHELRTPLNAILGWTQVLQATRPTEQTLERALRSLARNAQAQTRVIEDLLDVSRIITGKLQLSMASLDLRAVIESALEVIEPVAASKHLALTRDLPPHPCTVNADYDRLRQVLWNLLSNAVKFTPSGGRVHVRLAEDGASWVVRVDDTGIGVAPAFLPHVFERFRQADGSSTREQGGLGLGLAIVKELVELHGGVASAESAGPGLGSAFTVRLPRSAAAATATVQAANDESAALPRLDGVRVLVVDDNADAIDVVALALERVGATVHGAESGPAALETWERTPADVLICDLAMPGMDGFELLSRVRTIDARAGRATPALAVTAYASDDYRARCLRAGFQGHVAKPYNIGDIVRAVATAVGNA